MNPQYKTYIIIITVIALGIVGYTIYKSKTSATPSLNGPPPPTATQPVAPVASYTTPAITYGPTPTQAVKPVASAITYGPTPTQAVTQVASAITYGPTPSATQAVTQVASAITYGPTPAVRVDFCDPNNYNPAFDIICGRPAPSQAVTQVASVITNGPTPTQAVTQANTVPSATPFFPTYAPISTSTPPPAISSSDSKIKSDFSGVWKIATVNRENKSPVTLSAGPYVGPAGVYYMAPPYEWVFYRSSNSTDLYAVDVQYGGGSLVINIRPNVDVSSRYIGNFFKIYKTADGIVQFFGAPNTGYFFARDNTYKSIWSDPNYTGN